MGNVADSARRKELQELFEKHGAVTECDIIRDFAFVVRVPVLYVGLSVVAPCDMLAFSCLSFPPHVVAFRICIRSQRGSRGTGWL